MLERTRPTLSPRGPTYRVISHLAMVEMATRFFEKGKQALADNADWNSDVIKTQLTNLGTADTHVKAVTGASSATPIVLTITSHGWANGDIIVVGKVGGNLAANGVWKIANQATNTVELTTLQDGLNSTFSASYTSGGWAINLSAASAMTQVDAGALGTDQTLTTPTLVNGVLDADDVSYTGVPAGTIDAVIIYDNTVTTPLIFVDGKMQVVVAADAASSATTIWVKKLEGAIPNGTAVVFSNGITGTLTTGAAAGDLKLLVSAISGSIAAGHQADVGTTNNGFPLVLGSATNITIPWDNGASKIAVI